MKSLQLLVNKSRQINKGLYNIQNSKLINNLYG
jgi:hypothetical protein